MSKRRKLEKNKLLLVEGKDEVNFFEAFLSYLNILIYEITTVSIKKLENDLIDTTKLTSLLNRSFQWEELNKILKDLKFKPYEINKIIEETVKKSEIQIEDAGGIYQFKNSFNDLIKNQGFKNVNIIGIIRDAEDNADRAFQSICNIIKNYQLEPPSKVKEFSRGKPAIGIFIIPGNSDRGMLEDLCLETVADTPAMACVNPFMECIKKLSPSIKNVSKAKSQAFLASMPEIVNSIGLGAKKDYWNFEADVLNDLKIFIDKLI